MSDVITRHRHRINASLTNDAIEEALGKLEELVGIDSERILIVGPRVFGPAHALAEQYGLRLIVLPVDLIPGHAWVLAGEHAAVWADPEAP